MSMPTGSKNKNIPVASDSHLLSSERREFSKPTSPTNTTDTSSDSDQVSNPQEKAPFLIQTDRDRKNIYNSLSIETFYLSLTTKDMSSPYVRKKFWQLGKYQNFEFWRRLEYCFRMSLAATITAIILSFSDVEKFIVDKVYIIAFAISSFGPNITRTVFDCSLGIFGVALAALCSFIASNIMTLTKVTAFISICVSSFLVCFFLGSYAQTRTWFIVHNVYYFYVILEGKNEYFAFRQLLEFLTASFICCLCNLLPRPVTLQMEFRYKVSVAFELSIDTLKLLLETFQQESPGKASILFARAEKSKKAVAKTRDFLQTSVGSLWLELSHDFEGFFNYQIVVKLINNILLFISCVEYIAKSESGFSEHVPVESMEKFIKVLEDYTFEAVTCFLNKKKQVDAQKRELARDTLNEILSQFRNMRFRDLFKDSKSNKYSQKGHYLQLFQDFKMFCVSRIFYSITVLDQLCVRKKEEKNLSVAFSLLKKKIANVFNKKKIVNHFCSLRTYIILLQNTLAVLICTGLSFFIDSLYPQTMSLIFPVGFCWTDRMAGTYVRNLQRLLGAVFGCFYGLIIFSVFEMNKYSNNVALFCIVFMACFIKANQRYSYFGSVLALTSVWIIFSYKHGSGDNMNDIIFDRIKFTFLGTLISICLLMVLRPRRASEMLFQTLERNVNIAEGEIMEQKSIFGNLGRKMSIEENTLSEGEVKELLKLEFYSSENQTRDTFEVKETFIDTLKNKFIEDERYTSLNESLFLCETNFQLIHNLVLESSNEPQLFFEKTDKENVDKIVSATHDLINFVIVSGYAVINKDYSSCINQMRILKINFEEIFEEILKLLIKISVCLKMKKASLKYFEQDLNRIRKNLNDIDEKFEVYYNCMRNLISSERGWAKGRISVEQYRRFWGCSSLLHSLKNVFSCLFELRQALVFSQRSKFWKRN